MKFSVIIPSFNRRHLIERAIISAKNQTDVEVEIIVVDDGSSDGTVDWLTKKNIGAVKVISNARKKGPAGARNTGILAANGDYIALLDSDDYFLPNHLSDCQRVFREFPEIHVVVGQAQYERNGNIIPSGDPRLDEKRRLAPACQITEKVIIFSDNFLSHQLKYGSCFVLSTVALRANAAREMMNESLMIAEDYEYWVRLSLKYRFACLTRPQACYVYHESNISSEDSVSVEGNAPGLLAALEIMREYPTLEKKQLLLIEEKIAETLFSWGYRSRKHRQFRKAVWLHLRSFRFGKRLENLSALFKLALARLCPCFDAKP